MKIHSKRTLARSGDSVISSIELSAEKIAAHVKPGQFVVLMVSEQGERIPLTVVAYDIKRGTITLIFQEAGLTTRMLARLKAGSTLYALAGPLGHATEIKNYGTVVLVGGGVGIAEIFPVAKALKEAGNRIITILGARTKDLLILEDELRRVSDEIFITTDDGSYGRKGFVTDVLTNDLRPTSYDLIYAVGPIPMMKNVSLLAKEKGVRSIVSLNALMIDATGMCGVCRVSVGGKVQFTCVDGPEFDGAAVDWEELSKRNAVYRHKEAHLCRIIPGI